MRGLRALFASDLSRTFYLFWFFILFYFVCFISAGKAVRVVSGVNLFVFLFFLIRLVKHLLFFFLQKAA